MADETYAQIGMVLREHRRCSGLSQARMARLLHTSQGVICRLETGKRRIRYSDVVIYAIASGTTPQELHKDITEVLVTQGWLLEDGTPLEIARRQAT